MSRASQALCHLGLAWSLTLGGHAAWASGEARGVAGDTPASPSHSAASPKPAEAPSSASAEVANITTEVYFDAGSARLNAPAKGALDKWMRAIQGVKPDFVLSIGHADPGEGPGAAKALRLSELRAEAVRSYLAGKGFLAGQVYVEGKGDTQPVSVDNTPTERAKNRRVDVGVVGQRG